MFYLLWKRLWKRLSFYIAIGIGITLSVAYFWVDQAPLKEHVAAHGGVAFTPYTSWMGINTGFSDYPTLFLFLLPILVTLPLADLYAKDRRTGFIRFLLIRGKHKQYFTSLLILNFFTGVFVAIVPLLLNVYLSFMTLPNIKPDKIINKEMSLMKTTTFFPDLYYAHPFIHMLFYILLVGMFAGMFATVALGVGMFTRKSFIILLTSFAFQYVLNTVLAAINHQEMIASNFLFEHSPLGVSMASMLIQLFMGLFIGIGLYMIGVRKHVVC